MMGWWVALGLYFCGMLMYGVAFWENRSDIKLRHDALNLMIWPFIAIGAVVVFTYRRATNEEQKDGAT